jgi:uncharacterized membrane protein SpoIIM required for sporulation
MAALGWFILGFGTCFVTMFLAMCLGFAIKTNGTENNE